MDKNELVPPNEEGKPLDIKHSVEETTAENAAALFATACNRLRHPGIWHTLGFESAVFTLYKTARGNTEAAEPGDYLNIDIPGPGPGSGDNKDWVQVEDIQENFDSGADESCAIKLRPSINPGNKDEQETVAHFFKDAATSTIIIKRVHNTVTASYHGRNETPNLKHAALTDKIRNAAVAFAALAGFSKIQWSMLLKGLLKK